MIRVALIGVGAMGKKYALMLSENRINNMMLSAVCARSDSNKGWIKENLKEDILFYESTEELFNHADGFDAVLIVTPHKEHPRLALEAFKHKKHVFCDKPAGITVSEAHAMNEAAEKAGTIYAMMFHNRSFPVYQELKKMLMERDLGDILRILFISSKNFRTNFYHKSSTWRSSFKGEGGGMLINQGTHSLDIWQWLFGMPEAIYAKIPFGKYNDFLVDDEATILMEYPGKVTGTFIMSTGEAFNGEKLEVVGTKGRVVIEDNQMSYWKNDVDSRIYGKTSEENSKDKIHTEFKKIEFAAPENAYIKMFENFYNAIVSGEALIAPGEEGDKSLTLVNAAYLSAWKKEEVRLPFSEKEYEDYLKKMIDTEASIVSI